MEKAKSQNISRVDVSQTSLLLSAEFIGGVILSFVSLFLFMYLSIEVLGKEVAGFDTGVSHFVYSLRNSWLTQIMIKVSYFGSEFIMIFTIIGALILRTKKLKKEAILLIIIVLLGFCFNNVIKYLLKVPRPDIDPVYIARFYGFPSGHSMMSFILYSTLTYFLIKHVKVKKIQLLAISVSIIIILLVGFSRIYLGVHNPTDVIGGYIAGFWVVSTAIIIDKTRTFYRLYKKVIEK